MPEAPPMDKTFPDAAEAKSIQQFWQDHHSELLEAYPEQFVAVDPKSGKVIVSNPDLAMLVYELRDRKLSPRDDVAIEFISAKSSSLLL